MLDWYKEAGTMGGTCLEESLSSAPNHSLLPVWTATSALCVKIKRTFFLSRFWAKSVAGGAMTLLPPARSARLRPVC